MSFVGNLLRRANRVFTHGTTRTEEELIMKEKVLLNRVQNIDSCKEFLNSIADDVEKVFEQYESPQSIVKVKMWFQVKQNVLQNFWDTIQWDDGKLKHLKRFLVAVEKEDNELWESLDWRSRSECERWLLFGNKITFEMYYLRKKLTRSPFSIRSESV